jgi:hypothetical protein
VRGAVAHAFVRSAVGCRYLRQSLQPVLQIACNVALSPCPPS